MSDDRAERVAAGRPVIVLPCSGVGKAFGSISREATWLVVEQLRPAVTKTMCLALLTLGDEDAVREVRESRVITVDGCPTACARVNVEQSGGSPAAVRVFDVFRGHREAGEIGVTDIGAAGRRLARVLAEEIARKVDEIRAEEG